MTSPVLGHDTYARQQARERAQEATREGERERAKLERQNRSLEDGVVGFDKPAITQQENWSAYSHEDIYNTNQASIESSKVEPNSSAWVKLGESLRARGANFDTKLANIIRNGWQGEAAENAAKIGAPVRKWLEQTGDAFALTGNRLREAGSAATQAKHMVPPPQEHAWGRTVAASIPLGPLGGAADAIAQMNERREAEKAAREAMARVYSPTLADVDAGLPRFQKPDGGVVDPPPVQPREVKPDHEGQADDRTGTDRGGRDGGYSEKQERGGGTGEKREGDGRDKEGQDRDRGDGDSRNRDRGDGDRQESPEAPRTPDPESYPPDKTDSQWHQQPRPPTPTSSGGGGSAALGGVGGAGSVGGFVGGPGPGSAGNAGSAGRNLGAGGRAGVGTVGGAAAAGAGGAAARGASPARGGMMGGMAPQRGQGGQDDEHERPSWLEEQDEVWLNDMPSTAPPVIGE